MGMGEQIWKQSHTQAQKDFFQGLNPKGKTSNKSSTACQVNRDPWDNNTVTKPVKPKVSHGTLTQPQSLIFSALQTRSLSHDDSQSQDLR